MASTEAKPIVFNLFYDDQIRSFLLETYQKEKPIAVRQAVAKLSVRPSPAVLEGATRWPVRLNPPQFLLVRDYLTQMGAQISEKKAVCAVNGIAGRIRKTAPPDWLRFSFTYADGALVCEPAKGTAALEEGWFLFGESMWKYPLRAEEIALVNRRIEGMELVDLLRDTLPAWTQRGIPYECPLSYDAKPCVVVEILSVEPERVRVRRRIEAAAFTPLPGAEGYALCGDTVRPALSGPLVERLFADGDTAELIGDDIAVFSSAVALGWSGVVEGDTEALRRMHTVFDKAELILMGYRVERNGVGQAFARPVVSVGGQYADASVLSREMTQSARYVRFPAGYLSVPLLAKLGIGRMNRLADGTSLEKPYRLRIDELLSRGGDRLNGPWRRMAVPDLQWDGSAEEPLLRHFGFLTRWGFHGGIILSDYVGQLAHFCASTIERAPECRFLIVGKRAELDLCADAIACTFAAMSPAFFMKAARLAEITIAATDAPSLPEKLTQREFDILIALRPEETARTVNNQIYSLLLRIKARQRLSIFAGDLTGQRVRDAQWALLGIRSEQVARYAIFNAALPRPALPAPYAFTGLILDERRAVNGFAQVQIGTGAQKGMPIPARNRSDPAGQQTRLIDGMRPMASPETGAPALPAQQASFARTRMSPLRLTYENRDQRFVTAARAFAGRTECAAPFVPFTAYCPTYESMTAAQTRFYFFWRSRIRAGEYPPTDLSYVFLYVYELINLVGCDTPRQGYDKLMSVWKAYREAFPKLNMYLGNWAMDFSLLHGLDVPFFEIFSLCPAPLSAELMDLELLGRLRAEPVELNLELLAQMCDYDIVRSKFFAGHSALLRAAIPRCVALVDAYLKKTASERIVDLFAPSQVMRTRYLFRSAVYASDERELKVSVVPLSSYAPLREFLAQIVRFAENKLREITGFAGKLRGIELEDELKKLISLYLEREYGQKKEEPAPVRVVIDSEKLARLEREAEETLRMLSVETLDNQEVQTALNEGAACAPRSFARLAALLTDAQRRLLETLASCGFEAAEDELRRGLGDVMVEREADCVNEKALAELGGLLIVQEEGKLLVDEDYREELFEALHAKNEAGVCVNGQARLSSYDFSVLDGSWQELLYSLSPQQIDMLRALCAGGGADLMRIAESAGGMAEPLIDDINDRAMAAIGDLLIEDGAILPEYAEVMESIFMEGEASA